MACAAAILSPFAVCLMIKSYVEWRLNRWVRRTMGEYHENSHSIRPFLDGVLASAKEAGVSVSVLGEVISACIASIGARGGTWIPTPDDTNDLFKSLQEEALTLVREHDSLTVKWLRSMGLTLEADALEKKAHVQWALGEASRLLAHAAEVPDEERGSRHEGP